MRYLTVLFVLIFVAGCGAGETQEQPSTDSAPTEETSARVVDGVQVVEIEASGKGFEPEKIQLKAGMPARLVFRRTTEADCIQSVSVPEYGVEKVDLPMHEEVAVEFTPEEGGEFAFVCGMGMQSGTMVVST